MARRGAPSIYELLKRTTLSGGSAPTGPAGNPVGSGTPVQTGGPPSPKVGRAPLNLSTSASSSATKLEIPVLWMVVAVVAIVVAIVIAYNVGLRGNGDPAAIGPSGDVAPKPVVPATGGNQAASGAQGNQGSGGRPTTVPPLAATDNTGDPRQKGFKYFVLAHPSTERAPAMVEFCRTNGLDAYLVPDDNAMLRKIVVLPGYRDSSEKSSEPIRKLEAEIRRVGEKWKNAARGNKDFSDAYPEMFR